jgi:hypothetical protein
MFATLSLAAGRMSSDRNERSDPGRVGSVPGALDVMQAAGFAITAVGEEAYLIVHLPSPELPFEAKVTYLRLEHTLAQTKE